MANIKITVEGPLMDGHKITFKAPCNCDVVEKLDVRYIENNTQKSKLFTMKDSHGKDLTGLGNLFFKDAYVDVVLDINTSSAYLQNASTNTYLEEKIKFTEALTPVDNLESDRADLPLSAKQGKILNESLDWKYIGNLNLVGQQLNVDNLNNYSEITVCCFNTEYGVYGSNKYIIKDVLKTNARLMMFSFHYPADGNYIIAAPQINGNSITLTSFILSTGWESMPFSVSIYVR